MQGDWLCFLNDGEENAKGAICRALLGVTARNDDQTVDLTFVFDTFRSFIALVI